MEWVVTTIAGNTFFIDRLSDHAFLIYLNGKKGVPLILYRHNMRFALETVDYKRRRATYRRIGLND